MPKKNFGLRTHIMDDEDLIDLFAGLAMMAIISRRTKSYDQSDIAQLAYGQADEMIKEKRKRDERRKGILAPQGD